jgi:hypothetical protein
MGSAALAGPNANGTLVVTLADGVVYTSDEASYCGAGATSCDGAITRVDDTRTYVLNVLAAFPASASPRLAGVTFGVSYNELSTVFVAFAPCGDFELATGGWPGSGEGTAVTFSSAQTSTLADVYWFAGYDYYLGNTLDLTPHPTQGANFADDDVPSNLDPIADLGSFGFGIDGYLPCPADDAPGACCFADGSCEVLLAADCDAAGGAFQGGGTDCQTVECPQPATGACCIDGECFVRTADECAAAGGDYIGDDVPCDPNPCSSPTIETSWGAVKNIYR